MASVEKDFQVKKGIVVGSGEVSSPNASAALFNSVTLATLFESATSISIGATTGTTTFRNQVSAPNGFSGNLAGNASSATRLANAFSLILGGDLTGSVSIDGSGNVTLNASVAANSVALGTDTTGNYLASGAVAGKGLSGSATGEGADFTVTSNATENNTPNTIMFRDADGSFAAGDAFLNDVSIAGGSLTTTATTADIVDTNATTVNFAGAATTVNIGASSGNTNIGNNLVVAGNLTVSGTTTSVNSSTITVSDPVIALSKDSGVTADTLSRGASYNYGTGAAIKKGFFGVSSTQGVQKFSFIPDASEAVGNTFTGTLGAFDLTQTNVLTIAGNTGSFTPKGESTVTISGSNGVTVNAAGSTVTVDHAVSGVGAGTYGAANTVPVITVNNRGHITGVSNTAISVTSAAVSDFAEAAQDAAAGLLTAGTHSGISFVYNDAGNRIDATVTGLQETVTTLASAGAATTVNTFAAAVSRGVKYIVQAEHATAGFQILEVLATHNGTDVFTVEYANVFTGASQLVTVSANIVGGNVVLQATAANANTKVTTTAQTVSKGL